MPLIDLPADAQLDAPAAAGKLIDLPQEAQLDVPQIDGWGRLPALAGSYLVKGALQGAGAIGDLDNFLQRGFTTGVYNPIHQAITGRSVDPSAVPTNPLDSAHLTGVGRDIGVVDRPDLAPQNKTEKLIAAGSEGAGGVLPYLPLGGGSALFNAASGLTQGAAGGAVGEIGAEMFPDHPELARAAGNIVGALGAGVGIGAGNRLAGAYSGATSPTMDAYRSAGVRPTLAGDVTGNPTLQMIQAYAARSPGGAGRVHAASENAVQQWGDALENAASNLGASRTAQQAGEALQQHGQNWLDQFKKAGQQAWNQVDAEIPAATPVPVPNYSATVNAINRTIPTAQETAKVLGSPLSSALSGALTKDQWNTMVRAAQSPNLGQTPVLTWQDVKGIRSAIGERLSDPQLIADSGHAELKRIYGALSGDLANAAASQGPAAQSAFEQANSLTRNGHAFVENVLSKLMRGDKIAPEQAANSALNSGGAGGTMLGEIRNQMPTAADELAAYKLRDMGLANAGQQNSAASRLSPGTFVTDQAKLSPEATSALFGGYPDQTKALADVAGSMKNTERFLNTSNTGAHAATGHAIAGLAAAVPAAIEGYHLGGGLGAAGSLAAAIAAPFVPSYVAGRLATSPSLTRLLAAAPAVSPQSSGLLTRSAILPPLARLLAGAP